MGNIFKETGYRVRTHSSGGKKSDQYLTLGRLEFHGGKSFFFLSS